MPPLPFRNVEQPPAPRRRRAMGKGRGLALALVLAAGAAGAATMYKWVDANGRVIYSDQPPPGNVKSEIVKPPPPPVNPTAAQEFADKEQELKQKDKKKAEETKAAEKTRTDAERKREACTSATSQIKALQAKDPLFRYNEKGEKVYYDDEARRIEIQRQQQNVREYCTG